MWDKRAEYLGNADGNSVKMVLDQGFGDTKLVTLRLLGVYAPELSDKGGSECQDFVTKWFEDNSLAKGRWSFIVTTSPLDDGFVAIITNLDASSNLNAELAEFIYSNGYTVVKKEV